MNDTINVNGNKYEQLGSIKVNNREYVFGILNNDLDFFEKAASDDGIKYVATNKDLTLSGNAGTSLTRLNERIVMTHFADDLKKDIRNGKLRSGEDIKDEFAGIQSVVDEDPSVKKLLKGNVTDLDEEKFNDRAANLVSYFDAKRREKTREKTKEKNNFEIVDGGIDRTFANADLYKELEKQQAEDNSTMEEINRKLEEEHRDPLDSTIISPAFGMPTSEELDREEKKEQSLNDENLEPTFIVDKLVDEKPSLSQNEVVSSVNAPVHTNTLGIDEALLTPEIVTAILSDDTKVSRLRPEQITRLQQIRDENVKAELEAKVVEAVEEKTQSKGMQLVKKPDKKAAYVDTVILCLVTQLSIFGLLIFVLLLIK